MLKEKIEEIITDIEKRVQEKILEPANAKLLKKLLGKAESLEEAIAIAELGTTYKKTGFHFDKRLEKLGNKIKYFEKNEKLSFQTNGDFSSLTHKLIIGDNYEVLQNLLIEYKGKIDVIYIDPPYGKDSMGEFAKTNYENAITRDNLLSMLYPRLVLAKQLLSEDGVIFCSIDDKNQAYVKCLFDEVFEERNFINGLVWNKLNNQNDEHFIQSNTEYILCYSKNKKLLNNFYIKTEVNENDFNKVYNNKKCCFFKLEKGGSSQHREDRPSLYYSIKDPNGNDFYPIAPDGKDGRWRKKPENLDKDHIVWKESNGRLIPYEIIYLEEKDKYKYIIPKNIIDIPSKSGSDILKTIFGTITFSNTKPISLIKKLISIIPDNQDFIILDFFAGSGTTGQAVLELNKEDGGKRKFILCQLNEITETTPKGIAEDVTSKRLKRVMTGSCYDGTNNFKWLEKNKPLGDNLDVYEIKEISHGSRTEGKTPFDVIDETLYGEKKLDLEEKIKWVIANFSHTQKYLEKGEEEKC